MKRSNVAWLIAGGVLFVAQVAFFVGWRFVLRTYRVPTRGMSPAVQPGDLVFVKQHVRVAPEDIVAFRFPMEPNQMFIKRIVAEGSDVVELRDKRLFVNGVARTEPYAHFEDPQIYPMNRTLPEPYRSRDQFGPYRVPVGHYFTMGDNRDQSHDSRYWGAVPAANITGRAVLIHSRTRGFVRIGR